MKVILILLLVFFPLLGPHFSHAQPVEESKKGEILAIGVAPVVQENLAMAKKRSISRALMKGVEDYIIHLLGARVAVNNFERVTEEILPGAQEEIENFHILAEHQSGGKYKVLIKVRVNEDIIREKLRAAGVLLTETTPIKVLFMVSETNETDVSYWWKDAEKPQGLSALELALHKVFQDKGFGPINRTLSPPDVNHVDTMTSPYLQNKDVLKWGRLFSADVVVCGEGNISDEKEISLKLRALDVSQGIQVCQEFIVERLEQDLTDTEQTIAVFGEIVSRAAATLCPCITGVVTSGHGKIHPFEVTLTGMTRPKQFWLFSDFLREEVMGVKSVIPSKIKGNSISATVEFQGDGNKFVNRVMSHPKRPFPLHPDHVKEKTIVFNLE